MQITLHRSNNNGPCTARFAFGKMRLEHFHRPAHRMGRHQNFRNEHLTVAHFFSDQVHAGDQFIVENLRRGTAFFKCLGYHGYKGGSIAFHQGLGYFTQF